ncbi:MAG TPA: cation:proton antiporter, partial [Acidobacteriota bacterium]
VVELHDVELLAEIGVALLLFALGLELSFKDLQPVRRLALIGGPIQIVATAAFGYGLARGLLGWEPQAAVWFGAMISLSSTMVVLKVLTTQGRTRTLASRAMIGMLVVQDLAVAPLLIGLPALSDLQNALPKLGIAILQGVAFLAAMILVGTRLVPALLKRVASWNSRELFLVAVVALGIGVGYGTFLFGLSFAFGAFVAGMVLSESELSHQALSDIAPLRDIFGLVFFASAGMLVDPWFLVEHLATVSAVVLAVLLGKAVIFGGLAAAFGYGNRAPWIIGLGLAQVGEFSFVLARSGLRGGALSSAAYDLVLTATLITMLVSPLLARLSEPLFRAWRRLRPQAEPLATLNLPKSELGDHVVIAGYGRTGRAAAQVLQSVELPFVVVELSHPLAERAAREGIQVIWGDISRNEVLKAAGVARARLLLVTIADPTAQRLAIERARHHNSALHILTRSLFPEQLGELRQLGVYEAVQPEFEAGLELVRQVLAHYAIAPAEIQRFSDAVRDDLYGPLGGEDLARSARKLLAEMRLAKEAIEFDWATIATGSPAAGATIGALGVRHRSGGSIVAVIRSAELHPNPGADFRLAAGDRLAILGTAAQRAAARQLLESSGDIVTEDA